MVRDELPPDAGGNTPTDAVDADLRVDPSSSSGDVTRILGQIEQGQRQAADQLLPLVYEALHKLAVDKMAQERPGQTLQATALVHEAYLRLVDQTVPQLWEGRRHFFAAAAEAMRRILVEQARRKGGPEAGGDWRRAALSSIEPSIQEPQLDLLALNEALDQLSARFPRVAEIVKLRFFTGMTRQQAADLLGISTTTADDDWAFAKGWLRVQLGDFPESAS